MASDNANKLKDEYIKGVPEKIKSIEGHIQNLKKTPSKDTLSELRNLIHKMAGNAGSFGFAEVSKLCKTWDTKLDALTKEYSEKTDLSKIITELDQFLNELKKHFNL